METQELTVIEHPELLQVVQKSNIELSKAEKYAAGYAPFMSEVLGQTDIIKGLDKTNPVHAATAKRASLDLGKILSRATDKKKADKELLLLETRHIDNLFGLVETTGRLGQKDAKDIFEYAERIENERLLKLESNRKALLVDYGPLNQFVDLKLMDEETFQAYLSKEKFAFEAKQKADAEAEKKRIADEKKALADKKAKEKSEAEERERIRKENEELRKANEAKEKELADERERVVKENAERDRIAKIESDKQAKIQADLKAENERIAKELQAKKDQEEKEHEEEKQRIQNESSERIAKEKAAKLAPEREKVKVFFSEFEKLKFPDLTSAEGMAMSIRVNEALLIVRKLIISDSKNLL